jgi:hypothetical protein
MSERTCYLPGKPNELPVSLWGLVWCVTARPLFATHDGCITRNTAQNTKVLPVIHQASERGGMCKESVFAALTWRAKYTVVQYSLTTTIVVQIKQARWQPV